MMKILRIMAHSSYGGTGMTLLISMTGTIAGLIIGLLIGVFRTAPKAKNKFLAGCQTAFGWFLNVYIEIFRGTPMIVQSMAFSTVPPKPLTFPWIVPGPPSLSYPSIPELI